MWQTYVLSAIWAGLVSLAAARNLVESGEYGVDVSWPMHRFIDPSVSAPRRDAYDEQMKGCAEYYSKRECEATERARLDMNLRQPPLHHNYTEMGFKKMRVPDEIYAELKQFYDANRGNAHLESWPRGYTYVNTWQSQAYMISLEDRALRGGLALKQRVWDTLQPILSEWVGHELTPTSLYGIREYRDKAILATHVDRLPLVTSCIINVDQDVNEPWPLEVIDHAGKARNVTMEPGDLVLYESHTVMHGRPFAMNGKSYANVFVHFQPVDHEAMNEADKAASAREDPHFAAAAAAAAASAADKAGKRTPAQMLLDFAKKASGGSTNKVSGAALKSKVGGHEQHQHDESEIQRHIRQIKEEEEEMERNNTLYEEEQGLPPADLVRRCARRGHLECVVKILKEPDNVHLLSDADKNQWTLIHEAVRSNHLDLVKYLVAMGADLNARTNGNKDALAVAREFLVASSPVIRYLIEIGA